MYTENLQRRPSGVYVTRLVIPVHLRRIVGKREFVATTGTHHLPVAKLVAVTLLARWRQQLSDLERLARSGANMNQDSLIKIADGHPLLADDSYLPLEQAATVLGLGAADLLRAASNGRLGIYYRFANAPGFILPFADLEPDDGELGTFIVPDRNAMPGNAVAFVANSVLGGVIVKTIINGMTFDGATIEPMLPTVRDALIGFMAALSQAQAEATNVAQKAGIAYARLSCTDSKRYLGRKPTFTKYQIAGVIKMLGEGKSASEMAKVLGLSRQTIYRIKGNPEGAFASIRSWLRRQRATLRNCDSTFVSQGK